MISQLRKKHRTTQPSSRLEISLKAKFWLRRVGLGTLAVGLFATTEVAVTQAAKLQWGRPQVVRQASHSQENVLRTQKNTTRVVRDPKVIAAAWEDERSLGVQSVAAGQNMAAGSVNQGYDPFEVDDRLAQLADDPFDEPVGESLPELEETPETDLGAVEDAVEAELQRRRTEDDPLGVDMIAPPEIDPLEVETPLPDLEPDNSLGDDSREEGSLELEIEDILSPELLQQPEQDEFDQFRDVEPTPEELAEREKELAQELLESEENCREELEELADDLISSIDLSIEVEGNAGEDFPFECAVSSQQHQPRQWSEITYNWKAAAICHKPLYFEQVQLERYGHSWGPYVQPIMSGVHFFGTLPVLPYKMGIRTPTECVYTLGYYRPGSCAPYMIEPIPFTWRAAFFQGGAATGISFTVP